MYKKLLSLLLTICAFTVSCKQPSAPKVGADRDAHNCIASAGYTFSQVRQACIRIWEDGLSFTDVKNPNATMGTFVVFSTDFSQAELFIPEQPVQLLSRQGHSWTAPNSVWRLVRHPALVGQQENWELFQKDTLRYDAHPILTQPLYPEDASAD